LLKTRYTQVYQRQADGGFKIVHEHMSSPPAGTDAP
jgi:ketosteroid isomerase-like protein